MRPTLALRSGGGDAPLGKYNNYIGSWGKLGYINQKGIITYGLAANRQNPLAGAAHDAVFNTWRRFSGQVLYWLPAAVVGYYAMDWATEQNHYFNSKAGRLEFADME